MPVNVMDACALIAFLEDELGAKEVQSLLENGDNNNFIHAVNLAEVFKHYARRSMVDGDEAVRIILDETGIALREDMDRDFWKLAAQIWAKISTTIKNPSTGGCHSIAMADCFAIALAIRVGGRVITSDDEFTHVGDAGICPVFFYRPPGHRYDHSMTPKKS